MSNNLKIKTRFIIFWGVLACYILDFMLVKNPTYIAILALFKGAKFDIVSVWGLSAIVHMVVMVLQLFALILFNEKQLFAKRVTLAYIVSTAIFYSFLFYGSITGGAILFYIWSFLRNAIMFALSVTLFILIFKTRKIVFSND